MEWSDKVYVQLSQPFSVAAGSRVKANSVISRLTISDSPDLTTFGLGFVSPSPANQSRAERSGWRLPTS